MNQKLVIFFIIIILTTKVQAYEYSIGQISGLTSKPYQGDSVDLTTTITASTNNVCTIKCTWKTNNFGPSWIGNPEPLAPGESKNFGFRVNVQGTNGLINDKLILNCQIDSGCLWGDDESNLQIPVQFSFYYNGDGTCTIAKENCAIASSDCKCSSDKECRPNSERGVDSYGCATYCGNKLIEKPYEICSNCPGDVGKCDGVSCISSSECEGKFCVHNKCSHLAYIIGDTYCDKNDQENCKNSPSDCVCGVNQRCNPSGFCETYCGNNICEENERGICKLDCTWCGDGTCQQSESCSSCSDDCGPCKKATKEQELQRNIKLPTNTLPKTDFESSPTSKFIIIGVILGIIFIIFILYKMFRKKKKKRTHFVKCSKCHKKTDADAKFCHHCGHKLK